jgi:hypothetical protein
VAQPVLSLIACQLSKAGGYTQNPCAGHFERYGDLSPVETIAGGLDYFLFADNPPGTSLSCPIGTFQDDLGTCSRPFL